MEGVKGLKDAIDKIKGVAGE